MYLARPVVDPKRPHLPKNLLYHCVARDTGAAHDLDAAIRDAKERFGDGHLGHRRLRGTSNAAVEDAGTPVNHHFRLLQLDVVVSEHETNTLVVDQQFAEGLAPDRVGCGDLLRTTACSEPAHAM